MVIGGLAGVWISDLDEEGTPLGFEAMNWQGLDEGIAPGSYIQTIKYEPQDDLLILGTLGLILITSIYIFLLSPLWLPILLRGFGG